MQAHRQPEQALEFLQSLRQKIDIARAEAERANRRAGIKKTASDLDALHRLSHEIIEFLRQHPLTDSRGIISNLLVDELGVNKISWGRYLNGNSHLKTMLIGSTNRIFLAIVEEPKARVARILETYEHQHGLPLIHTGVPVSDLAADASIQKLRPLDWNEHSLHNSIGQLLDSKKYVVEKANVDYSQHKTCLR